ncbi:MAG: hypothetical protein ACRBBR_02655 [Cellvibrionaceae bacterium]
MIIRYIIRHTFSTLALVSGVLTALPIQAADSIEVQGAVNVTGSRIMNVLSDGSEYTYAANTSPITSLRFSLLNNRGIFRHAIVNSGFSMPNSMQRWTNVRFYSARDDIRPDSPYHLRSTSNASYINITRHHGAQMRARAVQVCEDHLSHQVRNGMSRDDVFKRTWQFSLGFSASISYKADVYTYATGPTFSMRDALTIHCLKAPEANANSGYVTNLGLNIRRMDLSLRPDRRRSTESECVFNAHYRITSNRPNTAIRFKVQRLGSGFLTVAEVSDNTDARGTLVGRVTVKVNRRSDTDGRMKLAETGGRGHSVWVPYSLDCLAEEVRPVSPGLKLKPEPRLKREVERIRGDRLR